VKGRGRLDFYGFTQPGGTCENQHKMKWSQQGEQGKAKAASRPALLAAATS